MKSNGKESLKKCDGTNSQGLTKAALSEQLRSARSFEFSRQYSCMHPILPTFSCTAPLSQLQRLRKVTFLCGFVHLFRRPDKRRRQDDQTEILTPSSQDSIEATLASFGHWFLHSSCCSGSQRRIFSIFQPTNLFRAILRGSFP